MLSLQTQIPRPFRPLLLRSHASCPSRCAPLDHAARIPPSTSPLFFFNDTATTEIYTLSLHDALPILEALAGQINERTKIIYLANPNNATGTIFTRHEFDRFYAHVPERALIILDEAYFEYAKDNPRYPDSMHYCYDNVIKLRTFSKVYGLAGARIGYGFAHETLIANLLKVKLPFEPSTLAQAAGIGALADKEFLHRSLELNARGIRFLSESLRGMGFEVPPSDANFVMVALKDAEEAARIANGLLREGIIVRPLRAFGLPQAIRISTGTDEENRVLVSRLAALG